MVSKGSTKRVTSLLAIAAIACGGLALAGAQSARTPHKLHEDIVAPGAQAARTAKRLEEGVPIIGPDPQARQNPTAIASQDKLLAEPSSEAPAKSGEPVLGRGGFGADRQTQAKPDYFTAADNQLRYIEAFNPSIVPFKRMSALDTVAEDYTLVTSSRTLADVRVGGKPRPNYDLFWGSILVDLKTGLDVPIPSVAPEMRILSYESTPAVDLVFSKDAADNYYLRTDETGATNTYRVVFLVEASPYYFAPHPPERVRIRDIPKDHLQAVPASVRNVATRALDELRLHDKMYADEALDKLVYYFRSFDAKSPPPNTGDIYWDLFKSQAGVCRHRSFAFMVTANTLGLPTRYVTNEAHAFVEVWLPGADWMRIDLGGAASTLNVENATDKSMYRPRGEDPFSKPETYEENYTRLEGDVKGLRKEQIADRQQPYGGARGDGEGNGSFFGDDSGEPSDDDGPLTGPGKGLPTIPDEELAGRLATWVRVLSAAADGYRGESAMVTGVVVNDHSEGIEGLRIDVFLAPAGNDGNDAILVGRGVSNEQGLVEAQIEIPASLKTEPYEVYVSTPGNTTYQPSVSN